MEFLYVIGIVLLISIILTRVVLEYYEDKRDDENILVAKDIVLSVENEIFLASRVNTGYVRVFQIPDKINNVDYNISIESDEILLVYNDMTFVSMIPNITGNITKGQNRIKNVDGRVCLNDETC